MLRVTTRRTCWLARSLLQQKPWAVACAPSVLADTQYRFISLSAISLVNRSTPKNEKLVGKSSQENTNTAVPVDPNGRLIVYEGALKRQITTLKFFSLSTSAMGLAILPLLQAKLAGTGVVASVMMYSMSGFFTFVTPVLIHFIAKKYVTELYYIPETDSYSAATKNFFNMKKEIPFTLDEVSIPDVPGPFTSILVTQKNKGGWKTIPLFVSPDTFNDPVHYGRIWKFHEPLNYSINDEIEELVKSKQAVKKN